MKADKNTESQSEHPAALPFQTFLLFCEPERIMALIFHIPRLQSRLRRLMNKHVRAAAPLFCRDYSSGGAGGKRVWVFKNKDVLVIGLPSLRAAHRAATLPRSLSFFQRLRYSTVWQLSCTAAGGVLGVWPLRRTFGV